MHHIVDPRTGSPAGEVWRTVSVASQTEHPAARRADSWGARSLARRAAMTGPHAGQSQGLAHRDTPTVQAVGMPSFQARTRSAVPVAVPKPQQATDRAPTERNKPRARCKSAYCAKSSARTAVPFPLVFWALCGAEGWEG